VHLSTVLVVNLYMARYKTLKVAFKETYQNQGMLLPPDLNDLVAADHPVRIVNDVLERIDISDVLKLYKPGVTSAYQPRMLLKVLVYGYGWLFEFLKSS
jgi:transposase